MDVYLSSPDGEIHDNVLVLGTNSNGAGEVVSVDGGLQCIRVHTSTASGMEAVYVLLVVSVLSPGRVLCCTGACMLTLLPCAVTRQYSLVVRGRQFVTHHRRRYERKGHSTGSY